MDSLCDEAQVTFGNRRAITHEVLGPINMSQWRKFHLLHSCHHVKQIAEIRREHGIYIAAFRLLRLLPYSDCGLHLLGSQILFHPKISPHIAERLFRHR